MGGRFWFALVLAVLAALAAVWGLARAPDRRAPVAIAEDRHARAPGLAVPAPRVPAPAVVASEPAEELAARTSARESLAAGTVLEVLGTVLDSAGKPLAGAQITVFAGPLFEPGQRSEPAVLATRVSAADGRFHCAVPSADGHFGVRVRAPGHVPKSRDQSPGVDVPFELVPAVRVRGQILGAGASEARVFHYASATQQFVRVDNGAGSYVAEDLPLGRATRFEVVPSGAAPFSFDLEPTEPGELVHDIELGPSRRVEGRVLDALDGAPIAGAVLSVSSGLGTGQLARSDARGEFALSLSGPWLAALDGREEALHLTLDVRARGYFARSVPPALLARGNTIELVPGARLAGRVLDGEGRPAQGAWILFQGHLMFPDERYGSLSLEAPSPVAADAEGRFVFACVPWGSEDTVLWVEHAGVRAGFGNVAPLGPRDGAELELRLPRGRGVRGLLVWEEAEFLRVEPGERLAGEPPLPAPAGLRVLLRCDGRDGPKVHETTSDARGRFAFEELPSGALELAVATAVPRWMPLRNEHEGPVHLPVTPPERLWTGILRAADGAPLADREMTLVLQRRTRSNGPRFTTRTDAQGGFEIGAPDFPGLFATLVLAHEGLELEHDCESARIDWTLPELVLVELFVPEALDGERWNLRWTGPGAGVAGALGGVLRFVDGRFRTPLPVGELQLAGRGPGGRVLNTSVTIRASAEQSFELHPR